MNRLAILLALPLAAAVGCGRDAERTVETHATAAFSIPAIRVRVAAVTLAQIGGGESVAAVVGADRSALLRAEVPGQVIERVVSRGARVAAGDAILRLDPERLEPALRRATADSAVAAAEVKQARRALARGQKLKAEDTISASREEDLETALERAEARLDRATAARDSAATDLEDATLRAAFAGVVEDFHVEVGDSVQRGAALVRLVDLERARLRAGVTASQASALLPGSETDVDFAELGKRVARLESVGVVASAADGTYAAEFLLENADRQLREGMVGRVRLPGDASALKLSVPRAALIRTALGPGLFIVEAGPPLRARLALVTPGRSTGGRVVIRDGANVGERVVIEGHFALSDGDPIELDELHSTAGD